VQRREIVVDEAAERHLHGNISDLLPEPRASARGRGTRREVAPFPSRTDAQEWAMVGVTPMIGQNDLGSEVFTTADARQFTG
jgi:hypothetical protein